MPDIHRDADVAPASPRHPVVIIGAGPIGLTLACALADVGIGSRLLERQARTGLAEPEDDGREIALTHRAIGILKSHGLWQGIADDQIAAIRRARVINGNTAGSLGFDPEGSGVGALGYLVANRLIRKAAFEAALSRSAVSLSTDVSVERIEIARDEAVVHLAGGERVRAPLVIAADSRHSASRRQMGIAADTRDFGRSVIVCRLAHDGPADATAYECFGYGRTLAILPLTHGRVSAVVTATSEQAQRLMRLPAEEFSATIAAQFGPRLGPLRLVGERHLVPLVAAYADRFVAHRVALAGDAAVGMHPVTAHGFNLGLYGVETLAEVLGCAHRAGRDIGSLAVLSRYDREHRRSTRPLYLGTNALVGLYTDDRAPARIVRAAALRLADRLPPLKRAITRRLTDGGSVSRDPRTHTATGSTR